jgi:hypothetical protein
MTIKGQVQQVLPLQQGTSPRGPWIYQQITFVDFDGNFIPDLICFCIKGKLAKTHTLKGGDKVALEFDIVSRKWKEKWFTELVIREIKPFIPDSVVERSNEDDDDEPYELTREEREKEYMNAYENDPQAVWNND